MKDNFVRYSHRLIAKIHFIFYDSKPKIFTLINQKKIIVHIYSDNIAFVIIRKQISKNTYYSRNAKLI